MSSTCRSSSPTPNKSKSKLRLLPSSWSIIVLLHAVDAVDTDVMLPRNDKLLLRRACLDFELDLYLLCNMSRNNDPTFSLATIVSTTHHRPSFNRMNVPRWSGQASSIMSMISVTIEDFSSLLDALAYFSRKVLAMIFNLLLPTASLQALPLPQITE